VTGTLPTANGGTNLTSFTSGGVVYASSSSALATGSGFVFDGTNLGIGNAPSAWGSPVPRAVQVGTSSLAWGSTDYSSHQAANAVFNGSNWAYISTAYASVYSQINGSHSWRTAASGTAGGAISFTTGMTLTDTGNLGVGTTSPSQKLHVNVASGSVYEQISSGSNNVYIGFDSSKTAGVIQSNNALTFDVGSSYTQRMVIDTSGNVGIGTSSPTSTQSGLDISSGGLSLIIGADNGSSTRTNAGNKSGRFAMAHYTNAEEPFAIALCDVTSTTNELSLGGGSGACNTATVVKFFTAANNTTVSGTERARITDTGYFKASNTGTYALSVGTGFHYFENNLDNNNLAVFYSNSTNGTQYGISIRTANDQNDTSRDFLECQGGGVSRARFMSNGGLANYSANNSNLSDRREKTNFAPATSYLDKICAIPVQTFNYIDQNMEEDGGLTLGVVAQDVQAVAPELVMESNWAGKDEAPKMRLSIYQTDLQYALMKALQELKAEFDAYKASHP
jgi:hypothetical protein